MIDPPVGVDVSTGRHQRRGVLSLETIHLEGLIEGGGVLDGRHTERPRAGKLSVAEVRNVATCHKSGGCVNPSFGNAIDGVTPGQSIRSVFGLRDVAAHIC